MRIALVHEWLVDYAGSERVLAAIAQHHPNAPIFTTVHDPKATQSTPLEHRTFHTSFLQRWPDAIRKHRRYLPVMPMAVEQHNLDEFDWVLSSHHCVAKGVLTRADQLHLSYVHSPMRYAWDLHHESLDQAGYGFGPRGLLARWLLHRLRQWDVLTASRVDAFAANSKFIAQRIWNAYRRSAEVIYPPVAVGNMDSTKPRDDFYLTVTRLVDYKRVDVIVQAMNKLQKPLVVIGDGPARKSLEAMVSQGAPIQFLGKADHEVVADHMARCRAFVFAATEDFGIAPVEAMAAGAPVIAYAKGGVTETVVEGKTGLFFEQPTAYSLMEAVKQFESGADQFQPEVSRARAESFDQTVFDRQYSRWVDRCQQQHQKTLQDIGRDTGELQNDADG